MLWIARDKDGTLCIFTKEPSLYNGEWWHEETNQPLFEDGDNYVWDCQKLNSDAYPEVTFENSPIELILGI